MCMCGTAAGDASPTALLVLRPLAMLQRLLLVLLPGSLLELLLLSLLSQHLQDQPPLGFCDLHCQEPDRLPGAGRMPPAHTDVNVIFPFRLAWQLLPVVAAVVAAVEAVTARCDTLVPVSVLEKKLRLNTETI